MTDKSELNLIERLELAECHPNHGLDVTEAIERIEELEADAATFDKTVAVFGELQDAYNALEDGLRGLPEYIVAFRDIGKMGGAYRKRDVLALLDSINPPKTDSKVSTVIGKESGDG